MGCNPLNHGFDIVIESEPNIYQVNDNFYESLQQNQNFL